MSCRPDSARARSPALPSPSWYDPSAYQHPLNPTDSTRAFAHPRTPARTRSCFLAVGTAVIYQGRVWIVVAICQHTRVPRSLAGRAAPRAPSTD